MRVFAGIDNGTQSTKVLVYDADEKRVLALVQAPHELISRSDGSREQLATWWVDALSSCFAQIDPSLLKEIKGIGVSGQQHGFVPVGGDGQVLAPVKLWCDTSTQNECDEITLHFGGARHLIQMMGNEVKVGYTASKILAFKKHEPQLYQKMAKVLLPHDYLNYLLTGSYTMEAGDASGTALFDVRNRTWCQEILSFIDDKRDWTSTLPPLVSKRAGVVSSSAAKRFGIPEGIPVSTGGGDNMMGAIGTGTVKSGSLTMSLGTSGTLYGASDVPVVDEQGRLAAFCSSSGSWLPLLCTMNCTVSSELTRSLFSLDVKEFDALALSSPIGAEGVVMLPFFNGERTPNYPHGKGTIFGLDTANFKKENLARAAMEASIYGLQLGLDAFCSLGFSPQTITLIGGGAKSAVWRQMVADVCNLPVRIPCIAEAAAFGGVLQVLSLVSGKSLDCVTEEHVTYTQEKTCNPRADNHQAYLVSYAAWRKLVDYVGLLYQ
ncbi:MAG: xylulokinase [Sphaerochaetaceae bacterium]